MQPNQSIPNSSTVRGDQSGGVAVGGERYGWSGAQEVRTTYGTENPDSLVFYCLGLSFTGYLWYTGVAVSLQTEYQRLAADAQTGQQTITNLRLPQP